MSESLQHLADQAIIKRDMRPLAVTVADIARETDRRLSAIEDAALILAGDSPVTAERPDADPTDERRPIGWADIMPIIATYDRIVRSNRTEGYDPIAAVAWDREGEVFAEVCETAADELNLSTDAMHLALENALRAAVQGYRAMLAAQLAAEEDGIISGR